jgi:hypothetical protein
MAIQVYEFSGTLKWPFIVNPSPKYNNYSTRFYPRDDATRRAVKATGVRNNTKEDDDGFYYQFRSDEKPMVVMEDGTPVTDLVGDGTEARIQLTVEDFVSAKYGRLFRGKLTGVIITKLVKYEPKEGTVTDASLPA